MHVRVNKLIYESSEHVEQTTAYGSAPCQPRATRSSLPLCLTAEALAASLASAAAALAAAMDPAGPARRGGAPRPPRNGSGAFPRAPQRSRRHHLELGQREVALREHLRPLRGARTHVVSVPGSRDAGTFLCTGDNHPSKKKGLGPKFLFLQCESGVCSLSGKYLKPA